MLTLKKIAVTGFPSTGKSTFCTFFHSWGCHVVNTDEIVHFLYASHSILQKQLTALLGADIVENGEIKRAKVARKVFSNPKLLHQLETIVHPLILEELKKEVEVAKRKDAPLFIAEIPLLYEVGFEKYFDHVILIKCEADAALHRFSQLRSADDYRKRVERFTSLPDHFSDADYIVENNGSLNDLEDKAKHLFKQLTS